MTLEKRIWFIGNLFVALLLLMSVRIVYWQLVRGSQLGPREFDPFAAAVARAEEIKRGYSDTRDALRYLEGDTPGNLDDLPQPIIQRTGDLMKNITRGSIFDRNGRVLAYDVNGEDGSRFRFYTEPSLAHTLGYVSGIRTGIAGLEATYNQTLLGINRPDVQFWQLLQQPYNGSDLILTVDSHLQRAAEAALSNRAGAIVVLDAHSGAVLAIASGPRFDPNRILTPGYVNDLVASCSGAPECTAPFLNRATQALYTPGSTWKTVTLIAGLDSGQVSRDTIFNFGRPETGPNGRPIYYYNVDGARIPDPNHTEARLDLEMSFAKSANAAFAQIGDEMNPATLVDYAARLGFGQDENGAFPIEVEFFPSQLANNVNDISSNNLLRAVTAIGQGELLTTPLNMAMVVLAVVNEGDLPVPYFVQSIRHPNGEEIEGRRNGTLLRNLMRPETAHQVREMMISVVTRGSGRRAILPGVVTGGKTGTAELGENLPPHSWFIGFAEGEERDVVIAVVVENAGFGSQTAAPIFAQLADVALRQLGTPVQEVVQPPDQAPGETPQEPGEAGPGSPLLAADIIRDPSKADITVAGPGVCKEPWEGPLGRGVFDWPSNFRRLSGGDFMPRHPGIDLAAPEGSAVTASDHGVVIYAGWTVLGYGNTLLIDHGNGYRTLYGHLSQLRTHCGAQVYAGDVIALSGNTGNSTGPHLHFEVRVPEGYVNPWRLLPEP